MFTQVALAMMAAAIIGPAFPHPSWLIKFGRPLILSLFLLLSLGTYLKKVLQFIPVPGLTLDILSILGFSWVFLHSPAPWPFSAGVTGHVAVSYGCGIVADDLIINTERDSWLARGASLANDDVYRLAQFSMDQIPRVTSAVSAGHERPWCFVSSQIRNALLRKFDNWPPGASAWLKAFTLGANTKTDLVTERAFRNLNLLHVVVLSGSHISVIASTVLLLFRLLPLILYSLRIISASQWPLIWNATAVIALVVIIFFSLAVGLGQSVQRAMIAFFVLTIGPTLWGHRRGLERLGLIFVLQAAFFPVNLGSLSMFLTWTGTLILAGLSTSRFRKKPSDIFAEILLIQLAFSIISGFVFGRIAIIGFIVNVVLVPLFSICLPFNFLLLIPGSQRLGGSFIVEAQMMLLDVVRRASKWQGQLPFTLLNLPMDLTTQGIWGRLTVTTILVGLSAQIINREKY